MQINTSGGSSETDANALTVIPYRFPALAVVTTVTPVVKWLMVRRNEDGSNDMLFSHDRLIGCLKPYTFFLKVYRLAFNLRN